MVRAMTRVATIVAAVFAVGCAGPTSSARAQTRAPAEAPVRSGTLTPEDVVNLKQVTDVDLSPDGTTIAYVLRVPRTADEPPGGGRSTIWIVPRRGGTARRLTNPDLSSWRPRWAPNSDTLAFLSRRGDDGKTQVHKISVSGGEASPVTAAPNSVSAFEWSPDGKEVAFTSKRSPTDVEAAAADDGEDWIVGDVRGDHKRLWAVVVDSGLSRPVTDRKLHIERFEWSPDGSKFVVQASERADIDATMMFSDLFVVDAAGGLASPLTKHDGKLGDIAWSPDGSKVAFLGASDIHDPTAGVLYVVPSSGGDAKALTADYEGTGQWVVWAGDARVVMMANQGADTAISSINVESGERRTVVEGGPVCSRVDTDTRGKAYVCAGATSKHPREVFSGVLGSGQAKRLTNSNPWLDQKELGAQSVVRWKAEDGLEIEGVLTKPVGYKEGTRYPLAILVHGGPEGVSHDGWNTRSGYPAQLFAARGYVVLEPNYRGSQGRGVAYGKADHKDLGGKEFTDVLAGIAHLDQQGLIDKTRVGMGGWSYGGYFSGLAATKYSEHFKAAMVGAAITDWISFTGTTEIESENSLVHWNLWPWDNFELAWDRSPVAHASKSKTATLIVHGDEDTRVPPGQAAELYRALRYFKTPTEVVFYPREGHGLRERAHQIDFQKRWLAWFDKYVKG